MIPRDTAKYIHIYRASLKVAFQCEESTQNALDKGSWPLPRPLTPKLRQRLCRVTLKHSQNFCTVQQTSIVNNQGLRVQESQDPGLDRHTDASSRHQSNQASCQTKMNSSQLRSTFRRKTFCLYSFASREQSRLYHNQNIELQ